MSDAVDLIQQLGGERVTYLPYGGVPTSCWAIVERRPSQIQQANGTVFGVNTMQIVIPMDATDGMLQIQVRKDRVRFRKNLSDSQESDFTVNKIVQEDAGLTASDGGMFRLEVQA